MRLITILFTLALTACVSAPNKQQIDAANYGAAPADFKQQIDTFLNSYLKDPDSAKVSIAPLKKNWFTNEAGMDKTIQYGYVTCVTINAKNSYGGYTGNEIHTFYFLNGKLFQHSPFAMNSGRNIDCF